MRHFSVITVEWGSDIPLMVNANMKWTVDQAIQASRAMAEYNVFWLEEPTIPDDVEGHRRIHAMEHCHWPPV